MNFDFEELEKAVDFYAMTVESLFPNSDQVIWIWRDSKTEEEIARLWLIFKDDQWKFEVLNVEQPKSGFLTNLAYALGNFAQENGIDKFFIQTPVSESREAFVHIGFEEGETETTDLTADTQRIAEYGNWRKKKGPRPDWHKELD